MALTARVRRLHRFLGVVVGLQILLWTASGIYFAWTDIDDVHGDPLRVPSPPLAFDPAWVAPGAIDFEGAGLPRPRTLRSLEIVEVAGSPHYRARWDAPSGEPRVTLAEAATGKVRGPLSRDEAVVAARASFSPDAGVLDVALVTAADVGPHHEYRGRPLPAWRVRFAHDSDTHVYVSADEGTVATHRNGDWRVFDFLWMLHTMDYRGRDDFNNPLLRAVAVLAIGVAGSGYLMWYRTRPRRRKRVG